MPVKEGDHLGPYEVLAPLGAGGMGEVWKARDSRLGRDVAIKVLPAAFATHAERLKRFELEARTISTLNHPNVLTLHDIGSHEGVPYLVMELLEGGTLREKLGPGGLPARRVLEVGLQIARGLSAAHEMGVVHRDLKPENIWVTRDGRVKILDFGLAKLRFPGSDTTGSGSGEQTTLSNLENEALTGIGRVMGTVAYMSPEQARGEPLDSRSDLFTLGVILWEMLTGTRPFQRTSNLETLHAILMEDPPEFPLALKVPPMLERVLHGCLAKQPAGRFHSAHDLAFALESVSGMSGSSGSSVRVVPRGWRGLFFRPGTTLGLCACLLAALGALGWLSYRLRQRPPDYEYKRLTFRRGNLSMARFSPDGNTILYSSAWENQPSDIFQVRLDSLESRPLGLPPETDLLSVSSKGELAIRLRSGGKMVLARVPLMGGTPREVLEDTRWADWSPDGTQLAVLHVLQGRTRVEYPIGTVLYETPKTVRWLRVSPRGDRLAIIEEEPNRTSIQILTVDGKHRTISMGSDVIYGLAWSQNGDRLITSWGPDVKEMVLGEIFLDGDRRILARGPNSYYFSDSGPGGRMLIEQASHRQEAFYLDRDMAEAKDLSWLEGCLVTGLSSDGRSVVLTDEGEGSGPKGGVWLRRTGSKEPIRLCDGNAVGNISPDGRLVPVLSRDSPPRLSLVPTGPGLVREIPLDGITPYSVLWHPRDEQLLVRGLDSRTGLVGLYSVEITAGRPKLLDGFTGTSNWVLGPGGMGIISAASSGALSQFRLDGQAARPLPAAVNPGDRLVGTSRDGRSLYVANTDRAPYRVDALDLQTGKRTLLRQVPRNVLGGRGYSGFFITPDGSAMAYSVRLPLSSDLYLMEGLRHGGWP